MTLWLKLNSWHGVYLLFYLFIYLFFQMAIAWFLKSHFFSYQKVPPTANILLLIYSAFHKGSSHDSLAN